MSDMEDEVADETYETVVQCMKFLLDRIDTVTSKGVNTEKCKKGKLAGKTKGKVYKQAQPGISKLKREAEYHEQGYADGVSCPICLDILHRPHACQPCGHVFCELCLRHLARSCRRYADQRTTACPVCRNTISHCTAYKELDAHIQSEYAENYAGRERTVGTRIYMRYPLPSSPTRVSLSGLTRLLTSQRGRRRASVLPAFLQWDTLPYVFLAIGILILKLVLFLIFSYLYNALFSSDMWQKFGVWLSPQSEATTSNGTVLVIGGAVLCYSLWKASRRQAQANRIR